MEERIAPPPDEANVPDTPPATAAAAQSQGGGSPPGGDPEPVAASAGEPATPIQFRLGDRLRWAAQTPRYERKLGDPVYRPLQIYTIDPSRRRREGQTAEINVPYERLRKGPNGCRFRMVKSGDWPLDEYDEVDLNETLVVVTGDHSHTLTIAGYAKRGNPILGISIGTDGQPILAADGKPYTTINFANGPGGAKEPKEREVITMERA